MVGVNHFSQIDFKFIKYIGRRGKPSFLQVDLIL